jgi:hypothetical protein
MVVMEDNNDLARYSNVGAIAVVRDAFKTLDKRKITHAN